MARNGYAMSVPPQGGAAAFAYSSRHMKHKSGDNWPIDRGQNREEAARADIVFVERRPAPRAERLREEIPGKYEHRNITGGIGHNLPPEAPQAFAEAVIDVAKF